MKNLAEIISKIVEKMVKFNDVPNTSFCVPASLDLALCDGAMPDEIFVALAQRKPNPIELRAELPATFPERISHDDIFSSIFLEAAVATSPKTRAQVERGARQIAAELRTGAISALLHLEFPNERHPDKNHLLALTTDDSDGVILVSHCHDSHSDKRGLELINLDEERAAQLIVKTWENGIVFKVKNSPVQLPTPRTGRGTNF